MSEFRSARVLIRIDYIHIYTIICQCLWFDATGLVATTPLDIIVLTSYPYGSDVRLHGCIWNHSSKVKDARLVGG